MKILDKMMEHICEELDGASEYTEKYIENKAKGNPRSAKYRQMALDEISHAENIYSFTVEDIQSLKKVYTLTEEEDEKWDHTKKRFAERIMMLKHTLENW